MVIKEFMGIFVIFASFFPLGSSYIVYMQADDNYELYIDGFFQFEEKVDNTYDVQQTDVASDAQMLALKVTHSQSLPYQVARVIMTSHQIYTSTKFFKWKCTASAQSNLDWTKANFDDSSWTTPMATTDQTKDSQYLATVPANYPGSSAEWIWVENGDNTNQVYCRAYIPSTGECSAETVKCADGSCIGKAYLCNGISDCLAADDEAASMCTCAETQVNCGSGSSTGCIEKTALCDDVPYCDNMWDEQTSLCPQLPDEEQCTTSLLYIDPSKKCDGVANCGSSDNWDEDGCSVCTYCGTNCKDCSSASLCDPSNTAVNGYYYEHSDPAQFVQCDAFGVCFEMSCSSGTEFDLSISNCNHAAAITRDFCTISNKVYHSGPSQSYCENELSMCWDSSANQCYFSSAPPTIRSDGSCCLNIADRVDAGHAVITASSCTATYGGCWHPISTPGPWCFYPDRCTPNPCAAGETCTNELSQYTCTAGPCVGHSCASGSTCVEGSNTYTCSCPVGYTGTSCDSQIDHCTPDPCNGQGSCANSLTTYRCSCTSGYEGRNCDTQTSTASSSSAAGATASTAGASTATTVATSTTADICHGVVCENSGTCDSNGNCTCTSEFTGSTCQYNAGSCSQDLCQNNSTCTDQGGGGFSCSCEAEYDGSLCQSQANAQESSDDNSDTFWDTKMIGIVAGSCGLGLLLAAGIIIAAARRRKNKKKDEKKETDQDPLATSANSVPPAGTSNPSLFSRSTTGRESTASLHGLGLTSQDGVEPWMLAPVN